MCQVLREIKVRLMGWMCCSGVGSSLKFSRQGQLYGEGNFGAKTQSE